MFTSLRTVASWLLVLFISQLLAGCEETTIDPAQYGSLAGLVVESQNNTPLANATITTTPATSSFLTDAQGRFTLPQLATGRYTLSARKTDYTPQEVALTVTEGAPTTVTLVLERAAGTNRPPTLPFSPSPVDQATGQAATALTLRWRLSDPDGKSDSLRSDVLLYESASTSRQQLLTNSRDTTVRVTNLKFNTVYFWQVTVRDKSGAVVRGSVWSFQTRPLPDNRYLYVREINGNTDIYAADTAGAAQRLTLSPFVETSPQLSPTRDRIAYTSNATGQYQLYTMNRDGSDARRITMLAVEGYANAGLGYRWSPDGAQLIYAHYDQLYRINRDGTGLTLLATAPAGRHFRECDWTAQGNRILVQTVGANVYEAEIYLLNADGTNRTLVLANLPGRLDSPSFSITGQQIYYTRDVDGFENATGRQLNAHLFVQNLDGTGLVDLSISTVGTIAGKPLGTNDLYPRLSPDGSRVIFVNVVNDNLSPPEVWTVSLSGLLRTRLFSNATLPDWK
ncbi:carboxypeptidase regulatory-like domain-containing protein [Hymenobacter norwichensis]|uniref:carboxypeptidase regulatory-like domain-containing protein n=1 Tax=Hymenobacter norwichensis TaxID=223903 RepID=UPI0003B38538|nr:carboxypeptidase regulatory-like domain-containing protein [Hymenobacter norwichensis]